MKREWLTQQSNSELRSQATFFAWEPEQGREKEEFKALKSRGQTYG